MARTLPDFATEASAIAGGARLVAGLDEVGRGPWAGPVVAAAVVLDPETIPEGLDDSKRLTAARREVLYGLLVGCASVGIGQASVAAGLMAINVILGPQGKVTLNFPAGFGFTGIAVALMGRSHPFGILLAALLFGALVQGGTELDFEFTTITREMVVLIQGLIILFSGALALMFVPVLSRVLVRR
jgi:hypothetical protein